MEIDYDSIAERINQVKDKNDCKVYDANWCKERVESYLNMLKALSGKIVEFDHESVFEYLAVLVNSERKMTLKSKMKADIISKWATKSLDDRLGISYN